MGGVWRTGKRTKRTCVGALRSKRGSCSSGGVWRTAKRDSTGYCSSPPSTPSNLHGLLFIHRRPPPASTCDCSSTGSCSSSLHHALLHRLLFNQPSPRAPLQPPLHGLLFIQPSTFYCSSSPPRGRHLHPALLGALFIQPQPARSIGVLFIQQQYHGVLFIQPPPGTVHPNSPTTALSIQRQHRSALVSSSSEGIARSGAVNSHRSMARVQ